MMLNDLEPEQQNVSEITPADAAEMLLAMARDDDPTIEGAAMLWTHARPLIERACGAVVDVLAEGVC